MATAKRPRRAAGDAPAKTAKEQNAPPAMPETSDTHSAPTLTMAADDSALAQLAAASAPTPAAPAAPAPEAPAPEAAAKPVADGPTLIQPVAEPVRMVPQPNSARSEMPARASSEAARAATAQSLASERAAMSRRRTLIIGGLAALVVIGGLLAYRLLSPQTPTVQVPLVAPTSEPAAQPTAAPVVQAQPTAAPVVQAQPTAAPVVQAQPTAAPVAQAQPTAAAAIVTCADIAGLPVFGGATCLAYDTDLENGVTETQNTYRTSTAPADVGRFYESAFASNGWTLQEFAYSVELGPRRLQVEVDIEQTVSGPVTEVRLSERGAAAGTVTSTTCTAIEGLPAYPNATCSDFDTDQDNGLIEVQNTYTTSASPEEIRSFYENAFKQSGWAGQEFTYSLIQGQRQLQVEIDPETAPDGTYTQIKVTAQ